MIITITTVKENKITIQTIKGNEICLKFFETFYKKLLRNRCQQWYLNSSLILMLPVKQYSNKSIISQKDAAEDCVCR